jgi:adenosine deaminase
LDLHTTAHAGEAAGADSVRGALDALRVQRIGHGTRAVEDPALVERLAAEGVALECCPTSNVRTGVIDTVGGHPLRQLMEAGVVCTINTDDPAMFQTSMSQEFSALQADLAFSDDEIFELARNAVRASWMTPDEKERRLGRIEQWRQTCWS